MSSTEFERMVAESLKAITKNLSELGKITKELHGSTKQLEILNKEILRVSQNIELMASQHLAKKYSKKD